MGSIRCVLVLWWLPGIVVAILGHSGGTHDGVSILMAASVCGLKNEALNHQTKTSTSLDGVELSNIEY